MTREQTDMLATWVNPAFLTLMIVAACTKKLQGMAVLRFVGRSMIGLILAIALAHINRVLHLWPRSLLFPSGHVSFVASVATSFILLDFRWAFLTVPFTIGYGLLIVSLKYHTWTDVMVAFIIAPLVTWLCHRTLFGQKHHVTAFPR
jgi:membrane-associated phospholipid phosphatase